MGIWDDTVLLREDREDSASEREDSRLPGVRGKPRYFKCL